MQNVAREAAWLQDLLSNIYKYAKRDTSRAQRLISVSGVATGEEVSVWCGGSSLGGNGPSYLVDHRTSFRGSVASHGEVPP